MRKACNHIKIIVVIGNFITVYDKILESTEHEFGEISNVTSCSSNSSKIDAKQLSLNSYIGANIKGRVFTNYGEFLL